MTVLDLTIHPAEHIVEILVWSGVVHWAASMANRLNYSSYYSSHTVWAKSFNKEPGDHMYKTVFHILFLDITMAICNVWQQVATTE